MELNLFLVSSNLKTCNRLKCILYNFYIELNLEILFYSFNPQKSIKTKIKKIKV